MLRRLPRKWKMTAVFCESEIISNGRYSYWQNIAYTKDEIRTGVYKNLFHPEQLISSMEDASNNFARGYYTLGRQMCDTILTQIRRATEACDLFRGFFIIHGFGGGTGSGLTSLIQNYLTTEYTKHSKVQLGIYPGSQFSTGITEPYNAILALTSSIDQSELSILINNDSLYSLCDPSRRIWRTTFVDVNRIVAMLFSCLTVSLRFESPLNLDMIQLETNLVPFPRIHFPMLSYSPVVSPEESGYGTPSAKELTQALFDAKNQTLTVDLTQGKIISCSIQYRGNITVQEATKAIMDLKYRRTLRFTDWCPTGIKLSMSNILPTIPSFFPIGRTRRSALMLMNNSAVSQAVERVGNKFDKLFRKRAFVHWFVSEGMEEGEFTSARKEMSALVRDYLEITQAASHTDEKSFGLRVGEQETMDQPEELNSQDLLPRPNSSIFTTRRKSYDAEDTINSLPKNHL